ncbi:MAG: DNA mismatch repair protein MutS, partial [Succinivibrio sp.]|nr:DNA mismatch repair protein MutS [Succinivibrio sp.]
AALYQGRKNFGCAYLSLSSGTFKAAEASDLNSLKLYIDKISPVELLVPEQQAKQARQDFAEISCQKALPKWSFEFRDCYHQLCTQFATQSLFGFDLEAFESGICAAGALLSYVKNTQKVPLEHVTSISRDDKSAAVIIDKVAQRNLELLTSLRGEKKGSLLSVLDLTSTPMGSRRLKHILLEPQRNNQILRARLNLVESLTKIDLDALSALLAKVGDIERITARIGLQLGKPKDLAVLRDALALVPELKAMLNAGGFDNLRELASQLNENTSILELLRQAILEDPSTFLRDGNVIAPHYNEQLDSLRELMHGSSKLLEEIAEREKKATGIATLKVDFNSVHGFYIEVPRSQSEHVPPYYQRRQTLKNNERYITPELKELEEQTLSAKDRALALEKSLFEEIISKLQNALPTLRDLAFNLALLDVWHSFAKAALQYHFVKPQLSEECILQIEAGRHPVIEQLSSKPFIPNDLILKDEHMLVITGPNMGGKSTYMRQAALIAIMARIGSFVPAKQALIGDLDRIFTRIGASDDLVSGRSTFMVEMEEAASIISNATSRSLVLMDEVGRGTSVVEGSALALAIAQYLCQHINCFTLFSTHYPEIATLAKRYKTVRNICFKATEYQHKIIFQYTVNPGSQSYSYATEVGKLAGLPQTLIDQARLYIEQKQQQKSTEPHCIPTGTEDTKQL